MLAFEEAGRGDPTVVLVHGFPFDGRMWKPQLATAKTRTIAVDLGGFGRSPDARTTIEAHADDLAALFEHLGLARVVLGGLSMGGYVALAFARKYPQKLAGLLLADTRSSPDSEQARQGRAANIERARSGGAAAVFEAMRPNVFAGDADPAHVETMRAIAASQSAESVIAALEAMRDRPDASDVLKTIRVPTRVVVGTHDQLTPPEEAAIMANAIPGAELVVIDGAAHFSNVENPEAFDAALVDLVQQVAQVSS